MSYYQIDYDTREHDLRNFGVRDAKGRSVGARVTFAKGEFLAECLNRLLVRHAPKGSPESGRMFAMKVSATRDNKDFGAMQSWQVFETEADRDAAKAKYLDGARKRAAKLAGK